MRAVDLLHRRRVLRLAAGLAGVALLGTRAGAADERVIRVVARKYEFVPDEIVLTEGETAVLELTAPDVTMGFVAADFGVRTDIPPGLVTRVRLQATRAGRFEFACDVFCGSGHEEMGGSILVRPA